MKSSVANWMVEHRHGRPQSLGYPHCNVLGPVLFWCSSTTCQSRSTASALSSLMTQHSTNPLNPFIRVVLASPSIWMQEQIGQGDGHVVQCPKEQALVNWEEDRTKSILKGILIPQVPTHRHLGLSSTGVEYNSHMDLTSEFFIRTHRRTWIARQPASSAVTSAARDVNTRSGLWTSSADHSPRWFWPRQELVVRRLTVSSSG